MEKLELCLRKSDYFPFIQAIWPSHTDKSLEHDLQPFLVKTIVSPIWFGYDYTSVSKRNS